MIPARFSGLITGYSSVVPPGHTRPVLRFGFPIPARLWGKDTHLKTERQSRFAMPDGTSGPSGTERRCGAECEDGSECQIPVESGRCHHHEDKAAGADSPNGESGTMPTEQSWWDENAEHILDMLDWSSRDGESDATTAARRAAKVRSEWGHEAFDTCSTNGCNRWSNGFEAEHCGKPTHQPEADEAEEDSDDEDTQNGFTRSEYEADLVAAGLSATEAAEKAEERFGGS